MEHNLSRRFYVVVHYKKDGKPNESRWLFDKGNDSIVHNVDLSVYYIKETVINRLKRILLISGIDYNITSERIKIVMHSIKDLERYVTISCNVNDCDITEVSIDYDREDVERFFNE